MNFLEFLQFCQEKEIRLSAVEQELKVNAPPGTLTPELVAQLRERKAELLAWLQAAAPAAAAQAPLVPVPRQAPLPLSHGQETLWLTHRLDEVGDAYHFVVALDLDGALDRAALDATFAAIIARHEALRSTIADQDGVLQQRVGEAVPQAIGLLDLSAEPPAQRRLLAERCLAELAQAPFDLARDPMIRLQLVRLGDTAHQLIVVLHHIASDGWSLGVLVREFQTLYTQAVQGAPLALPALPVQYPDYAHWQRAQHDAAALAYWKAALAGVPELHSLPLDRSRPAQRRFAARRVEGTLTAATTAALKAYAARSGATLFMVLETLYCVLLSRYSQSDDIVFGTPVANRTHADLEGLIGYFVNMLVLRHRVDHALSFEQLLQRTRADTVAAFAHQHVPFEAVLQAVLGQRSTSYSPLVQIAFILQNNDIPALQLPGLACQARRPARPAALFDLQLEASDSEGGLRLCWDYAADLFDDASIVRLARHFEELAGQVLAQPTVPLAALPAPAAACLARQLAEWNDTGAAYPSELCIHELFERQAAAHPQAPALECDGVVVSYGQLNARANRLAHHLRRSLRCAPDTLVGVCMERSPDMVVALLAIVKAGAAYVPFDADAPQARRSAMLADAAPVAVLTEARRRDAFDGIAALCLDDPALQAQLAAMPAENIAAADLGLGARHLAYVIYTSGSSGVPKGVMVEHRSLVNLACFDARLFDLQPGRKLLNPLSLGFDAGHGYLWDSLCAGACLVLHAPGTDLYRAIDALGITHAVMPAALLQAQEGEPGPGLQVLISGGDACSGAVAARLAPGARFFNVYGPTENTVTSTFRQVVAGGAVDIGRPIANVRCYVLGPDGAPLPLGCIGELYLGGAGLARGYLKRPELDAEKFVANPFAGGEAAEGSDMRRLYRTGDLVRWTEDGNLQFHGRIDGQVKVRGFRIELGEIEHALLGHPAVHEAVVLAHGEQDKRLVAYLVAPQLDVNALRAHLAALLPDYMVPSAFMVLAALPLTQNGKVDRKALPAPDPAQQQAYVAPASALERRLCAAWQEVLGIERIGLDDNFFHLGGHSLTATRLITRVNDSFGVQLPLKTLFNAQTLGAMAQLLEQAVGQAAAPALPLVPVARNAPLLPSFTQQRLWLLDQINGGSAHYNMPGTLHLRGALDRGAVERAFGAVLARHEVLRTVLRAGADRQPLQVIQEAAPFTVPLTDLSGLPAGERQVHLQALAAEEAGRPFDLAHDLMLRAQLVKLDADEHVLLVTLHHIAADGWSMAILVREFSQFYQAAVAGAAAALAPLELQYADYAQWQRASLQGERLERELGYWSERLAGLPAVHALPLDHPRPRMQSFAGRTHRSRLAPASSAKLASCCAAAGATLFMGLHAAFAVLLARYSNETDIVIGSPIANREQAQVAQLIGFFVNMLVLRSDLSGAPSFAQLLAQSRQTLLDAYAHQQVPFEQIVERLQPARNPSHSPLFQVMLVLQNNEQASLELPGLTLSQLQQTGSIARYDLTLTATEGAHGLDLEWEYNTDLFEAATIERLAGHFAILVDGLLDAPDASVFRAGLLTAQEHASLAAWNATAAEFPRERCMHQFFEQQAAGAPQAPAVICGDEVLSYGELNRRANQLAHYLAGQRAVGPDSVVGICLERSCEMVIAILAVLKAGGAYLPLDPDYPAQRLAYMAGDAQLTTVLTHSALPACVDAAHAVALDGLAGQLAAMPEHNPERDVQPRHLAYVIYTSGSTGNPKGVMVEHEALVNRIVWMDREYGCGPQDRILQKTPFSFDVSVWEFFWPLAAGAAIVMAQPGGHRDPVYLSRLIERSQVTKLHFVPSMLASMLAYGELARCRSVRQVFCSGEALSLHHVDDFHARLPGVALHNLYGPTEAAIDVSYYDCARRDAGLTSVPIGRPIANIQLYVLGPDAMPVPQGVAGELHIGGVGLARGYLGRPQLSAEKFVANPFHRAGDASSSARLYRTGDLARMMADGEIEYLGRIDHQVKLRGLRIELGEIEHALMEDARVKQALVAIGQDGAAQRLLAYIVPAEGAAQGEALFGELKERLARSLPEYMVPAAFMALAALPLSPNGKADRKALPPIAAPLRAPAAASAPRNRIEATLCRIWQELLQLDKVSVQQNFFESGGTSLLAIKAQAMINEALGCDLAVADLFAYPTIGALAQRLSGQDAAAREPDSELAPGDATTPIAIIGMAGRVSGARDLDAFWANIRDGVESIQEFTDEELLAAGADPALLAHPDFVKKGVLLDERDLFDAAYFGFTPREAELTCPQQRLMLECAVEALEHAGYGAGDGQRKTGVFISASNSAYFLKHLMPNRELVASIGLTPLMIAADKDFIASRIAYKLNLTGPVMSLNTACSSALVALAQACLNLAANTCDRALVGAVAVQMLTAEGYLYQEGGIASPDGHCRPFDRDGAGTRGGSGVGAVLLKRLDRALADGDTVHAVIRGVGVNNDGNAKVGYAAPSVQGEAAAIRAALAHAGAAPASIGYVETHGTGTTLGDPIEIAGLKMAFGAAAGAAAAHCALGAVKASIGHLDAAAGMAGLLKAVQAIRHRTIPPLVNYRQANAQIDLSRGPFYIPAAAQPWDSSAPRRAGVSAFGIGGTNAHVVLEEAPAAAHGSSHRRAHLLLLSAKTPASLEAGAQRLARHLSELPAQALADAEFTLQAGRAHHPLRRFAVSMDPDQASAQFGQAGPAAEAPDSPPPVVFMFPGQGAQYAGMTRGLYQQEPVFRAAIDRCAAALLPALSLDVRALLFPADDELAQAAAKLAQTAFAQPALFAVEYALATLWMAWGVRPAAMIGHSLGEIVAACLAGVFTLDDALRLVAARGRLMQDAPAGRMLSVLAPQAQLAPLLAGSGCEIAAINSPQHSVVAGSVDDIGSLRAALEAAGLACTPLRTAHAFHSRLMDGVLEQYGQVLAQMRLAPPAIPILSNLDGMELGAQQATSPAYWVRHLRQAVDFSAGITALLAQPGRVLLEVGPGMALGALARKHPGAEHSLVVSSTRHEQAQADDQARLLEALGQLWQAGVEIDWAGFHAHNRCRRIAMPAYAFDRQSYWIDAAGARQPLRQGAAAPQLPAAGASQTLYAGRQSKQPYVAPRDAAEERLVAIWQQLLGLEQIGVHDSFFDLGGDSLQATRLVGMVQEQFGIGKASLSLKALFERPRVADLAAAIGAALERQKLDANRQQQVAVEDSEMEVGDI